jgi:hypothetical protein
MSTSERLHIRFSEEHREVLEAVAAELSRQLGVELDASATVRMLVIEKARKLGLPVPPALGGPVPKKKRRGGS